jgi:hypothetical protein
MSFVIVKAQVGFIVRPNNEHPDRGMFSSISDLAAFDTWEQASAWIGVHFEVLG